MTPALTTVVDRNLRQAPVSLTHTALRQWATTCPPAASAAGGRMLTNEQTNKHDRSRNLLAEVLNTG